MKNIFYVIAFVALVVLVISSVQFMQKVTRPAFISFPEIAAMGEANPDQDYTRIIEKFRKKVEMYTSEGRRQQKNYFWCTFLVTVISAASTLILSIQASRKDDKYAHRITIIVAFMAFLITIGNFTSGHLDNLRTDAVKNAADLSALRSQFFDAYKIAEENNRHLLIGQYETQLDN